MTRHVRNRIFSISVVIAIFVIGLITGQYRGRRITEEQIAKVVLYTENNKITRVVSLIENSYVDSVSSDSIAEIAIPKILETLDPHSVYIPAREFDKTEEPLQGEFDGIGIVFNMATDTAIVLNVIPSGPSQKAGVQSGDRIIKVNDTVIAGQKMAVDGVMKRLRGKRGTTVHLSLERKEITDLVEVDIIRDAIPLHSVEAAVMITPDIGFIKLSQFSRTSYSEVSSAIEKLRNNGMKSLVLDLRGNSGGFLDQAILISNEFLPKGSLIVYTEDRKHHRVHQFSDGKGKSTDISLAVLIDEGSASSSEILAGAIQDNDRGTIIGRRSFGKGLVQSQIPFPDGSALRLTVARYYTPTGRSIQKPYSAGNNDYEMDIINRFNHNELFSADSIHFADSLRFTTPKGKIVYGGGGIMPDEFIPIDTTNITKYYIEVSGRNILYRYTIDYADKHRKELDNAKTTEDLVRIFNNDKDLFNRFVDYASLQGVKPVYRDINRSKQILESQIKAFIARNSSLDNGAFYYFIRPIDTTMQKAVDILGGEKTKNPQTD